MVRDGAFLLFYAGKEEQYEEKKFLFLQRVFYNKNSLYKTIISGEL